MTKKQIKDYLYNISTIRSLDINQLSIDQIERSICDFGLFPAQGHKPYFDKDNIIDFYRDCIIDGPLSLWQKPNELSKTIHHILNNYTINSFLEIGTHRGGTFLILREFLKLKNPNLVSLTIDPYTNISQEVLQQFNINYSKITIDNITDHYDLIFIDGNHAYDYVKHDYEKSLLLKPKILMFHDIISDRCLDVIKLWQEIRKDNKHQKYFEFVDLQPAMGIGIIEV
jgi:hypothetical protein